VLWVCIILKNWESSQFFILITFDKPKVVSLNINLLFFSNVVICYCMSHNMILNGKYIDIDELLFQLETKKCAQS
jgi:hypothetical protein